MLILFSGASVFDKIDATAFTTGFVKASEERGLSSHRIVKEPRQRICCENAKQAAFYVSKATYTLNVFCHSALLRCPKSVLVDLK